MNRIAVTYSHRKSGPAALPIEANVSAVRTMHPDQTSTRTSCRARATASCPSPMAPLSTNTLGGLGPIRVWSGGSPTAERTAETRGRPCRRRTGVARGHWRRITELTSPERHRGNRASPQHPGPSHREPSTEGPRLPQLYQLQSATAPAMTDPATQHAQHVDTAPPWPRGSRLRCTTGPGHRPRPAPPPEPWVPGY